MTDHPDRPGYSFNPGPPQEVSRYLKNKGFKIGFSWLDTEPEEHAAAFTAAKAMQIDLLKDIRDDLQKAIDEGLPFRAFAKNLTPRLQARGWWGQAVMGDPDTGRIEKVTLGTPRRLKTIYDANIRTARAAGQWERIQRTKELLPYLEYRLGPSEDHRPHHEDKAGLILPVDDPFWDEWMPPNGWGCKCWVKQITRRAADAKGGPSTPPVVPDRMWTNKRTGEVRAVPVGIDPGWQRNPGQLRLQAVQGMLNQKMEDAPAAVQKVALRDIATSWRVARIMQGSVGGAPVMIMPGKMRAAASASTPIVQVTAASKQHLVDEQPANAGRVDLLQHLADADLIDAAHIWFTVGQPAIAAFIPGLGPKGTKPDHGLYVVVWFNEGPVIRTVFPTNRAYYDRQASLEGRAIIDLKEE